MISSIIYGNNDFYSNAMNQWDTIIRHIEQVTGDTFAVKQQMTVSGGSINNAYVLSDEKNRYFVKTNASGRQDMFEAEAKGLQALAQSHTLMVPLPICYGDDQQKSYIVMEYLEMDGSADQARLGEQLAAMHQVYQAQFGWHIDNTIGSTPQINTLSENWLHFWCEQRLGYQLTLAAKNGYTGELQVLGEKLLVEAPKLFTGHSIRPSMLHGDLWGGNVAGLADGTPVIFDPAFYYGDREADLAMTYVFGGFTADFYASYQEVLPLDAGFPLRRTFYNIYHILNHMNMFGGGYQGQSLRMMQQVLANMS